jgi:hypothetical protein
MEGGEPFKLAHVDNFYSPKLGSMSEMAIYQQLTRTYCDDAHRLR